MKIVSLQAENVKRLRAVEIRPDPAGNMVIIGGQNEQGKTSVLDSIEMALRGGDSLPPKPIREGATRARIVAELDDLSVKRTFTRSGSYLEITAKDGAKLKSPQALLDSLVGRLSFDPLCFSRQKPEEQAETLRKLVGLDVSDLDAQRARLYDERTQKGRELKNARGSYDVAPSWPDAPAAEVSLSELAAAWQAAVEYNRAGKTLAAVAAQAKRDVEQWRQTVAAAERHLRDSRAKLAEVEAQAETAERAAEGHEPKDELAAKRAMDSAEDINLKVRENAARRKLAANASAAQTEVDRLTAAIEQIDQQKRERLAAAAWPIPGLGLGESGVEFRGIPFRQCSSAQQLEISVAMGLTLNPKLRVLLIRDGSLLDDAHLAAIAAQARAADAQVWVERVGDKDASAVIIEDGSVRGQTAPPAPAPEKKAEPAEEKEDW